MKEKQVESIMTMCWFYKNSGRCMKMVRNTTTSCILAPEHVHLAGCLRCFDVWRLAFGANSKLSEEPQALENHHFLSNLSFFMGHFPLQLFDFRWVSPLCGVWCLIPEMGENGTPILHETHHSEAATLGASYQAKPYDSMWQCGMVHSWVYRKNLCITREAGCCHPARYAA
jgi:hypothetical protein